MVRMLAMDDVREAMETTPATGDADLLLLMIPHHPSAIDMARVALSHGDEFETLALAQAIIDAQEQEIAGATTMLARLGVDNPR